ncbi:hypothetical protein Dimus_013674 [Dionaea muscipula]
MYTPSKNARQMGGGWSPVFYRHQRRRITGADRRNNSDVFTVFVENILERVEPRDLCRLFNNFGVVEDVFIPAKRNRGGKRFGFVRYGCPVAAEMAIQKGNKVMLHDKVLMVKQASYERSQGGRESRLRNENRQWLPKEQWRRKDKLVASRHEKGNLQVKKSYAEAVAGIEMRKERCRQFWIKDKSGGSVGLNPWKNGRRRCTLKIVERGNLEIARVRVNTTSLAYVDDFIHLRVKGKLFMCRVIEEQELDWIPSGCRIGASINGGSRGYKQSSEDRRRADVDEGIKDNMDLDESDVLGLNEVNGEMEDSFSKVGETRTLKDRNFNSSKIDKTLLVRNRDGEGGSEESLCGPLLGFENFQRLVRVGPCPFSHMDRNNTREEDLIQHSEEREGGQLSQGEKALTVYTGSLDLGQIRALVNPPVLTTDSFSEISNSSIASRTRGRVRANMEPI